MGFQSTPLMGKSTKSYPVSNRGAKPADWDNVLDVPGISEILPGMLYQSGIPKPELSIRHKVTLVFNMSYEQPVNFAMAFGTKPVPMQIVNPIFDGGIDLVDLDRVHWLARFAADHIHGGGIVLSHCQMGWNRSGLLTGLIMYELGFKDNIVAHIQKARGRGALCNQAFAIYLEIFQRTGNRETARNAALMPRSTASIPLPVSSALNSLRADIAGLEENVEDMTDDELRAWLDSMGF